jgi:AGCS family alanine or glycine:cation symporter
VPIPYGQDIGINLTTQAFSAVYGEWISLLIVGILCLLALATILGWGLYGARCAQYLFGENIWRLFVYFQFGVAVIGAVLQTETVWLLAEIVNGLMLIPNLITLAALSPELLRLVREYKKGLTIRPGP